MAGGGMSLAPMVRQAKLVAFGLGVGALAGYLYRRLTR